MRAVAGAGRQRVHLRLRRRRALERRRESVVRALGLRRGGGVRLALGLEPCLQRQLS